MENFKYLRTEGTRHLRGNCIALNLLIRKTYKKRRKNMARTKNKKQSKMRPWASLDVEFIRQDFKSAIFNMFKDL